MRPLTHRTSTALPLVIATTKARVKDEPADIWGIWHVDLARTAEKKRVCWRPLARDLHVASEYVNNSDSVIRRLGRNLRGTSRKRAKWITKHSGRDGKHSVGYATSTETANLSWSRPYFNLYQKEEEHYCQFSKLRTLGVIMNVEVCVSIVSD